MKYHVEKSGEISIQSNPGICNEGEKKSVMHFENSDFLLALSMLVCGFLYWDIVQTINMGLGVLVFTVVLYGIALCYFHKKGLRQNKASLFWLMVSGISALQFVLFHGDFLKSLNLIFLSACFIYWVAVSTGQRVSNQLSLYTIWDLINQTLLVPFANFTCGYCGLKYGFSKSKHSKNIKYVLGGFFVCLPLMVFVIIELSLADAAFETLLGRLFDGISIMFLLENGLLFIMGIPVACYLFGLIYGNQTGRNVQRINGEKLDALSVKVGFTPKLTVYTVLITFNVIYVIFFLSQTAYFLSAFENILPARFTYAEYARHGFFELCKVSGVNMVLIILARVLIVKKKGKEAPKMLRVQTALLSVMTMGLITTALRKMYMYIQCYGLTQLRIYTSWFMILLFLAFAILLIRQIKAFHASRIMIIGGIIGFMILSYGNVDGNIAKYNIEGYESGRLESLDYDMLIHLSDGAVPYLHRLYEKTTDERIRSLLYWRMACGDAQYGGGYEQRSLKNFNLQSSRAESIGVLLQSEGL